MRLRVKMTGLVSHTTPNGKSYSSGRNKCEQGVKKLIRLIDEGYKLTGVRKEPEEGFKLFGEFTIEIPDEILNRAKFKK